MAITDNVAFIFNNIVEQSTITCNNESATLPATNIKNSYKSKPFRSATLGSTTITGILGTALRIDCIAVVGHNIGEGTEVYLKLYDVTNALVYTSPDLVQAGAFEILPWGDLDWGYDPYGAAIDALDSAVAEFYFPESQTLTKKWELVIVNPVATTGNYVQIRKVFMGMAFRPKFNFSLGYSFKLNDDVKLDRTSTGVLLSDLFTIQYRTVDFDLSVIDELDRSRLLTELRVIGRSKDFFVSLFPESNTTKKFQYRMIAKLADAPDIIEKFSDYYSTSIRLEEA